MRCASSASLRPSDDRWRKRLFHQHVLTRLKGRPYQVEVRRGRCRDGYGCNIRVGQDLLE